MIKTLPLVVALAMSAASLSGADARDRSARDAYGRATSQPDEAPSIGTPAANARQRAQAIRECEDARRSMINPTWGVRADSIYRACMARHGQPE